MVYGAQRSLLEMEKDEETKSYLKAYTAGVNSYIDQLTHAELPLEIHGAQGVHQNKFLPAGQGLKQ